MKILCDLIYLGAGTTGSKARTGVFRVVERLTQGLAATPGCETWFHAFDHLWPSWVYYQEHLRNERTHFTLPPGRLAASRHLLALERFVQGTVQNRSLPLRALRYGAIRYRDRVDALLSRLDPRLVQEMDVYHSAFLPIPKLVKRYPTVCRFTTVYDLIALSHPQFFNANVQPMMRAIVGGFDEDDHALCISAATRDALLAAAPRLRPERVSVTPLAAGPDFYPETDPARLAALRARLGLPPDAPYFLSLCTLEPRKNLDSVVRAFARLKASGEVATDTRLVLVGNLGWRTETLLAALEEARPCRDAIVLTGFVPDEDLAALYSGAQAFVYMSWMEGFGLPPLEAMQCGVPVICSNTSSLPEVVGDAGLLLAPDDLDGIAAAMSSLANDEGRRHLLAARGLERARLFSWERFVESNLAAYRAALATR